VKRSFPTALLVLCLSLVPAGARAAVLFQNAGTTAGWDKIFIQQKGTVTQVETPSYQGGSALEMTQTFLGINGTRYHSEVIKDAAQQPNTDVYYGQVIYLPPDWQFHNANETFQQLAPDDNSGPWILMYVQNDHLYVTVVRTSIAGARDLGPITTLRGTWIRIVLRMVLSSAGTMEVWVNGDKVHSEKGNFNPHSSGSIRWSNGVYATRWIKEQPVGPRSLTILHDHLRVATTYAEADPASWQEGPAPDGGASIDATAPDAGEPPSEDSAPPADASPDGPAPIDARPARADAAVSAPGGEADAGERPPAPARSSGCSAAGSAPHAPALALLVIGMAIARSHRRRRSATMMGHADPVRLATDGGGAASLLWRR
jgi:MYXO-CTERM domain-containing protein